MQDPVTAADGRNYERELIQAHCATGRHTSPMTGAELPSLELVPNSELQRRCQEFELKQEARRANRAQRKAGGQAKQTGGAAKPAQEPPKELDCSVCAEAKPKSEYSGLQWRKEDGQKCKPCMADVHSKRAKGTKSCRSSAERAGTGVEPTEQR